MADGGSFRDGWIETARGFKRATKAIPRVVARVAHLHFALLFSPASVAHVAKHVWAVGHDDQRVSWFAHWLICLGATVIVGGGGGVWVTDSYAAGANLWPMCAVAFVMWLVYLYREAGDTRYHEDIAHDWDKLDQDTDWQGRPEAGTTARYDRVGDLTGPTFNCFGTLLLAVAVTAMTWGG